jgi:hypothetical protein
VIARVRKYNRRFRLDGGGGGEPGPLLPPKFAALQHGNSTWLTTAANTRRDIVAGYDMVMCGLTSGLSGIAAQLDYLRSANPDIVITQYMQVWEVHGKGILSIALVSGTTYRFTLDGTGEGASSNSLYGSAGAQVKIRGCATGAFNGIWTMAGAALNGTRPSFTVNIGSNPVITGADATASLGACCLTSDAHHTRFDLVAQNGGAAGWFLRGTVGGVANRIKGSGVDATQRAVNFHKTTVQSGGLWYPQVKADWDKANLVDPYQPTIGDQLVLWLDNWNYRPRASGLWGSVEGGPVGSTEITSTDTALAQRNRVAAKLYADRHRINLPGVKIIGNADGVSGAAPAGIQSLDFSEWPEGTLDGAFIEEIYGATSSGAEDTGKIGSFYDDNWVKLIGRLREQRRMVADPGLHVVQVQGRGANNAAQQQDHQFFMVGLAATLMLGDSRATMSLYAFTPVTHDVTVDHVRFAERDAALGEPIEAEQTAARGFSGASTAWARAFQGGAVVANASTTAAVTITTAHLASLGHPVGTLYDFLSSAYGTLNTGGPVVDFELPPKSAVLLVRRA